MRLLPILLLALPGAALASPEDTGAADTGAEVPPLLKMPELLEFSEAPYPPEAEAAGIEGEVLLELEIDETGAVRSAEVIGPAGHGFDEAAVEAARGFRFSPAEDASGPVPVIIEFAYSFELAEETASEEAPEAAVTLEGSVIEMGTRRPLPEAAVVILAEDGVSPLYETLTDEGGHFQLRGVPPGRWTLRVARPGWEGREIEVEVVEGQLTTATIWVERLDYGAGEAVGLYRRETEEITRRSLSVQEIRRVPGTFGDPVRVIQSLPGAARSPFGTGALIIRGSNPEDSGVYVEGIRIPLIYHLGGYVSVLNADMIEAVDYLPGGYGVQYGRSTGGVIDVRIKEEAPEQARLSWSTDLLDSGGIFEGRLGRDGQHQVGIAARRSYIDLIVGPIAERTGGFVASPRWMDYQLRYHYAGGGPTEVTAFLFGFRDQLLLSSPEGFAQGTDADFQGDVAVDYGTHRGLVTIERALGDVTLRLVPSFGVDYNYADLGGSLKLEVTQWLPEIRAEAPWTPSEHFALTPGVDFIGGTARYRFELPFDPEDLASFDPIDERDPFGASGSQAGWGPDFYLKAAVRPLRDPEALLLLPGLRADYVNIVDQYRIFALDPRFTFRARALPKTFVKGGTGIYNQPPQPFESYRPDGQGVELGFERAWSSALGLEQELLPGLNFEVEGFYKALSDLIVSNPDFASSEDQYFVNDGLGRIYGMEIMAKRDPVGKLLAWVSYTLSRSERSEDPGADPNPFGDPEGWAPYDFDQTHILVAVASYRLPFNMELGGRFQYVTGNPYTPYAGGVYDIDQDSYFGYPGEYNAARLPPTPPWICAGPSAGSSSGAGSSSTWTP